MLPIKKIYVDTRFKSPDSASDSDFYIDLPQTLLMPEKSGFYIDDVSIPMSWFPIEEGRNNKMYIELFDKPIPYHDYTIEPRKTEVKIISLEEKNYTNAELASAIELAINSNVYFVSENFHVTVTYDKRTETITILGKDGREWKLLTDKEIEAKGGYPNPPGSMNMVLNNKTPQNNKNCAPDKLPNPDPVESIKIIPFRSGYLNLYHVRNVYILCNGLGNFNTMSLSGERAVVKKVPVTAGYGEMIFNESVIGMDYLDCSRQTLSRLGFRLANIYGETINLHGHH